jgi:hypothetical protein
MELDQGNVYCSSCGDYVYDSELMVQYEEIYEVVLDLSLYVFRFGTVFFAKFQRGESGLCNRVQ